MEAPKKIFLRQIDANLLSDKWLTENEAAYESNVFEYTRTDYVADAFIEKACQFIKEHHHEFSFWNTEEYELGFSTQKFIEDFKKYMKN